MPKPVAALMVPLLAMVQTVPAAPSMPSAAPVEVTWPVLVMLSGLSAVPRETGPVVMLVIVLAIIMPLLSDVRYHPHGRAMRFERSRSFTDRLFDPRLRPPHWPSAQWRIPPVSA